MHRIANSDGVRESVGIEVDGQHDWRAWATLPTDETGVICLTNGEDALAVAELTTTPGGTVIPGVVQGHWAFATTCRGRRAIDTGKAMIAWLHEHGQRIVWGSTPNENRKAIWFNRMIGGLVLPTSDAEFTNFEWRAA
jgi:hypothetical protein